MTGGAYLYILRCRDGSLYVGTTRSTLEARIAEHNAGTFPGYTASRRPVELLYSEWFDRITDAIACERKLKRWSRAKKTCLYKRRSRRTAATGQAQDGAFGLLILRSSAPAMRLDTVLILRSIAKRCVSKDGRKGQCKRPSFETRATSARSSG